jgi:hypothetical protein
MLISVGQYVRVSLSPDETRKALVATIDELSNTAELMLLSDYGNSLDEEKFSSIELSAVPISSLRPLLPWEFQSVSSLANVDMIRELAKEMFKLKDWVGAVNLYREAIFRLRRNATIGLVREAGGVFVVNTDGRVVAKIDPNNGGYILTEPAPVVGGTVTSSSVYSVGLPVEVHATMVLNVGRSLLNQAGCAEDAIGEFSNGIFIACLEDNILVKNRILAKMYFWRSRARLSLRRGAAAIRDASLAMKFATDDPGTHGECRHLLAAATRIEEENQRSNRKLVKEIMKVCAGATGMNGGSNNME